jgi:hypothetical protein
MAVTVQRPKLSVAERSYIPAVLGGLLITLRHFL